MDLTAPVSAPSSSFILDDDAAESFRTSIASASETIPKQETYAEPVAAAAVKAPESALNVEATCKEPHPQASLASPDPDAVDSIEEHSQQSGRDPIHAASLSDLTNGQSLAQAYAIQPPEAAAAPRTAAQVLAGQQQHSGDAAAPSIAEVLSQLKDNAASIRAAEEALQHFLAKQSTLLQLERKLEQQHVISAVTHPLGFQRGRPVAAVLLLRCLQEWGVFTADQAPVLEQLSCVLQEQLCMDDESAPADVAGLQCRVAYWLTVSSVLLCLLLKTLNPSLAAAAHSTAAGSSRGRASEVVTAARRRVGELQQHLAERVGHMSGFQGGLQALGRRFGGWGKGAAANQKQDDGSAAVAAGSEAISSRTNAAERQSSGVHTAVAAAAAAEGDGRAESAAADAAAAAAGGGARSDALAASSAAAAALDVTCSSSTSSSMTSSVLPRPRTTSVAAAAAAAAKPSAAVEAFMLCLDGLVQKSFVMLRDQLKRRLAPLLSDCMMNPGLVSQETLSAVSSLEGSDSVGSSTEGLRSRSSLISMGSYNHAGAAVGGAAAANRKEAEAVLMNFRSWSELVGVLHAAVVALRGAGVPRALTAALVQQVLEFINCQMFNQLLLRPECCSASNARYVLRGLKQLDGWILAEHSACGQEAPWSPARTPTPPAITPTATGIPAPAAGGSEGASQDTAAAAAAAAAAASNSKKSPWVDAAVAAAAAADGTSWEQIAADGDFSSWQPQRQQQGVRLWQRQQQREGQQQQQLQHDIGPEAWHALSHVRQALQFLVLDHKGALSLDELSTQICPALNYQQLYRLCTTAWTDAPGEDGCVSGEVLEEMKQREKLSTNGGLIVTFLLDDPTTLPFVAPVAAAGETAAQIEPSSMSVVSAASTATSLLSGSSSSSGGSMRCKPSSVVLWDDGRDYGAGMPVPVALVNERCPEGVFEFLLEDRPWVHY